MQATSICYYRRSKLPFARPQRPKTLRGSFDRQLRPGTQATAICYYRRSRLPFARPQRPKTLRGSFDQGPGTQATAICYYRRLPFARPQRPKTLRGTFDQARWPEPSATICPPSKSKTLRGSFDQALRPQPSATIGVRGCRLPALKGLKRSAAASTRHSGHSHLLLSGFEATVCPPSKAQNAPRQLRPGTQATAICYYRRSRLPFAHPQRPKTFRGSFDQALEATAICYYRRSRLPFAGPQRPKALRGTFDQALSYFGHNHLFFGVCKDQAPATAIYF